MILFPFLAWLTCLFSQRYRRIIALYFMFILLTVFCFATFYDSGSAFAQSVLTVPIEGRLIIPDGTAAGNLDITLNGDLYSTMSRSDGSFTFHEIPTGIYMLDVQAIKQMFPQMKIKVSAEDGSITVVEYKYHGAKRVPSVYPLLLTAVAKVEYFQTRPPFSLMGMIMGNPMMLMMLVSAVVVIGMPKLIGSMSPEELEEMKKSTAGAGVAGGGDPMKQLTALLSGKPADSAANDEDDD